MTIRRITMSALPLLVASSSAFAAPADHTTPRAAQPRTPVEEPVQVQPAAPAPAPPRTAPPPPVGTTHTTSAYDELRGEPVTIVAAPVPPRSRVEDRLSIEPMVGFGSNNYNVGLGVRAGYTFKVPVYIGGTVMWHFGETRDFFGVSSTTEASNMFAYPAAEIGFDIIIGHDAPVVVRPYGGAGVLFNYRSVLVNGFFFSSDTHTEFLLYPGLTAHYHFPRTSGYLGVDARLLVPVASTELSYQAFLVFGASL